jgi:uncharacterized protein
MNRNHFISLVSGLLFGLGLSISGMTDPLRVLGFLDMFGQFDPSLIFVLGGAVLTSLIGFTITLKRTKPIWADAFDLPLKQAVDRPLVMGSILFGLGWGASGYCPGPALASLAQPTMHLVIFVAAMLIGMLIVPKKAV